jgi:hypothetical protein
MAVVACLETTRGTGLSGKHGESFTFPRKWIIRVDSPTTSRIQIAQSAGISYGDGYPDATDHKAMEFDLTEESGDGMLWGLTWRYYLPPAENTPDPSTGLPADYWSGAGRMKTIPVFKDKDGTSIANSAGDPLEGTERESTEASLTLTKCYESLATWSNLANYFSNSVNASAWNTSSPRTWKCEFRSSQKKLLSRLGASPKTYWEVVWDFVYREETWDYQPWDIGFNQLVTSDGTPTAAGTKRAAILGADKKPVKSPVALASGVAKDPGQPPDALRFHLYREANFSTFGTPG